MYRPYLPFGTNDTEKGEDILMQQMKQSKVKYFKRKRSFSGTHLFSEARQRLPKSEIQSIARTKKLAFRYDEMIGACAIGPKI